MNLDYLFRQIPPPPQGTIASNRIETFSGNVGQIASYDGSDPFLQNDWDLRFVANNARVRVISGTTGLTAYQSIASVTGSGYLLYWYARATGSNSPRLRITIDGVQTIPTASTFGQQTSTFGAVAQQNGGAVILKPADFAINASMTDRQKEIIRGLCAVAVRFNTSLQIETQDVSSDTSQISTACDYVLDSELE